MKAVKITLGVLLMLMFCNMALARETVVTKASEMRIDLVRYDPSPVQPGSVTEVWFEVTNLGATDMGNLAISLVEDYPFTLRSDKEVKFEKIMPNEKKEFSYKLYVNPNSVEGSYILSLQYYSEKLSATTSSPFTINVKKAETPVQASIQITSGDSVPTAVEPGHSADVTVKVKNTGSSAMRDVTVKLDLSAATIPFAPLGMTSEQKIRAINAGGEGAAVFTLIALPNAEAGVYKIPVSIKYYDEQGYLYETSNLVGIVIGAAPKISVELDTSELTTKQKSGKATFKVINYGTTNVKFMRINIAPGNGYEVISKSEAYLGDIDSDDYDTAEFRIKMLSNAANIKVLLDYKDANNMAYNEEQTVSLKLYTPAELGISNAKGYIWVVAIVLAIVGYVAYKKLKKRRHHQQ